MVKIVKGSKTLKVTKSAFDNYYANSGWRLETASAENAEIEKAEELNSDDNSADEWEGYEEEAEEIEKPLSEMNREELTAKAVEMGLDISSVNSNKQLRELIKTNM